jgi:two-component system, cell cycle sensor histidine kinase and response regulator CckA
MDNQETKFRLMVEHMEDVIFTLDLDLRATYVSPSIAKVLGYSPEERMRQRPDEQLTPESLHRTLHALFAVLERGEDSTAAPDRSVTLELEYYHRDGSTRIMETFFRGLRDPGGQLVGIYGLSRDISARKKMEKDLRESEERYRDLVENSQDVICTHDLKGKLLSVSGALVRFLGYPLESLLKMNLADLLVPEMRSRVGAYLAEIQIQGRSSGIMRVQTAGGETRFWEYKNTLRTEGVAVPIVRGMAHDITERTLAEKALRQSEASLQAILRSSADGILAVSPENKVLFANELFVEMWRIPQALMDERSAPALLNYVCDQLDDPQEFMQKTQEIYAARQDSLEILHFKGGRVMERRSRPLIQGEQLRGRVWSFRDISETKRKEEALRQSEERYRAIFDQAVEGFFQSTPAGRFIKVNQALARMCGYDSPEEMMAAITDIAGQHYTNRKDREVFNRILQEQGVVEKFEHETLRKDGSSFWTAVSARAIRDGEGRVLYYEGTHEDIDQRKKAERRLVEAEEQYRSLFETATNAILIRNREGRIIMVNPAGVNLLGAEKAEDLIGQAYLDLVHPEDRPLSADRVEKIFLRAAKYPPTGAFGQTAVSPREHRMVTLGGEVIYVESTGVAFYHKEDYFIQGIFRNITERKQAEAALRESEKNYRHLFEESKRAEELYRSLLNSSADAIAIYDLKGNVQFVNPSFTQTFGWTLEELVGRRIPFVPDSEKEVSAAEIRRVLETGASANFETRRLTRDGRILHVTISGSRYDDHQGVPAGILVILHDITRTKTLEAQIRQVQKMEAIGTLAGGIAHDFNNLLQVIGGYSQLLLWAKSAMDPGHYELLEIQKAVQRAAQLIRQLLTFSRKVEGQRRIIDLNQEILEAEKVLKVTIPKMIALELHLGGDLDAVQADPVQIEQILLNLGSNAADAMPDGGRLILETCNASLQEEFCRLHPGSVPGPYVLLTVADTGQGMDRETVQHIFEPFFTTKEVGKGTGLGLASVYGIVKSHGGYILCESEAGQGTRFRIYLPVVAAPGVPLEKKAEETPFMGGLETILVVDDEASVRELAVQILQRQGYQVLAADCGEAALEIFQTPQGGVDLVILDLGMPGMGGLNCLRELLKRKASAKVLIASGYSVNGPMKEGLDSGAAGFIGKPYALKDLLSKVRTILDGT